VPPAVFLDRDGTMVHDVGYLSHLKDLEWYPWTIDAVRLLKRAGFLVCVTTNQSGIALGFFAETFVGEVHREMAERIARAGAQVDGWFYCPHHPHGVVDALRVDCDCRKPQPGMIRQAQRQFEIDLGRSFVVGDKLADVRMAKSVGARGVLVRTGYGESIVAQHDGRVPDADHVAVNLMDATAWILGQAGYPREAT
jgi:D-glycero-D-manno-heptose 1,7-bisphosphate phosphatase